MAKPVSRFAEFDAQLVAATQCKLCAFIAEAPAEDATFVDGMLRDAAKGHMHVQRVLAAGGVELSESSIKRHRAKHL